MGGLVKSITAGEEEAAFDGDVEDEEMTYVCSDGVNVDVAVVVDDAGKETVDVVLADAGSETVDVVLGDATSGEVLL